MHAGGGLRFSWATNRETMHFSGDLRGLCVLVLLILSGFYTHALDIWLHYGAKCLENINQ